jgi:hypothetical protein
MEVSEDSEFERAISRYQTQRENIETQTLLVERAILNGRIGERDTDGRVTEAEDDVYWFYSLAGIRSCCHSEI